MPFFTAHPILVKNIFLIVYDTRVAEPVSYFLDPNLTLKNPDPDPSIKKIVTNLDPCLYSCKYLY